VPAPDQIDAFLRDKKKKAWPTCRAIDRAEPSRLRGTIGQLLAGVLAGASGILNECSNNTGPSLGIQRIVSDNKPMDRFAHEWHLMEGRSITGRRRGSARH